MFNQASRVAVLHQWSREGRLKCPGRAFRPRLSPAPPPMSSKTSMSPSIARGPPTFARGGCQPSVTRRLRPAPTCPRGVSMCSRTCSHAHVGMAACRILESSGSYHIHSRNAARPSATLRRSLAPLRLRLPASRRPPRLLPQERSAPPIALASASPDPPSQLPPCCLLLPPPAPLAPARLPLRPPGECMHHTTPADCRSGISKMTYETV